MPRRVISVVGCHAEGEVGDVITGGVLPPVGATMMDKKLSFERAHDHIRRMLICEPRGSVARHVNLLLPPTRPDCAAGAIIMEPTEYPAMSGSNTICIATVLLETGMIEMIEPETRFRLDMPGGPVDILAQCRAGKCESVTLSNVPAFVLKLGAPLEFAGRGTITIDISYGGMFYAIADARALGFAIAPDEARDLAVLGEEIRRAAREQHPITHPELPDVSGVSIVQFAGPLERVETPGLGAQQTASHQSEPIVYVARNTCIVAPGRSDRSPTGTGTSARMAVLHARGQMRIGDSLMHESIIGSRFEGKLTGTTQVGLLPAVETTIRGRAWLTGLHQYFVDASDPWPSGYIVSDTWGAAGSTATEQ